jgi:malonate-semialdehyde dehydrogenase (acetylating)/methylmalonate-semialdehyde dehydrogenase
MAASLMLAVGDVEHLISRVAAEVRSMTLGQSMGAIIDKAALKRIRDAIDDAERRGAKILVDGRKTPAPAGYEQGNWIGPTIIDQAKADWPCAKDEIFGPVLTIVRCNSLADAMQIEASSTYGNATSVFTTNGAVARFVSEHATSGMIGVNVGVPVPREPFSFGGTKQSKFGVGDITGTSVLDFWTNLKKITTKWTMQQDATWMS